MSSLVSNLKHVNYADDICLLAEKISDVAKMFDAFNVYALEAGLKINIGKIKLLSLPASEISISIRGKQVDNVNTCTYLGCELAEGGGTMVDIQKRIYKARDAFGVMCSI